MDRETKLWHKWTIKYISQIIISLALIYAALFFGKVILFSIRPTWQVWDTGYLFLRWVDNNQIAIFCMMFFVCAVLWALYHFRKLGAIIDSIMSGIASIYEKRDDRIQLPKDFAGMENQLNEVRIQAKADMQAAQEANQRKNDLIMYMAHDLKTPLTSVIGYLTLVCQEEELPIDIKQKYAGIALKKSLRLETLINEFFDITRFNFSHMVLQKSTVNISVMLQQIISEFMAEFQGKGLQVTCDFQHDLMLVCDINKMERVFDNIIKNIVNYSYRDTEIKLTMKRINENQLEITTENHGKTIPPEMTEHIFDQFFRLDSSRNSSTGGSGLGLAVAKEIVQLHDGSISCTSQDERIMFRITLPGLQ